MKVSVRVFAVAFVVAMTGVFSFGASRAQALPMDAGEITLDKEAIQILKGSQIVWTVQPSVMMGGSDTVNLKITFTNHGDPGCENEDSDIIGYGIGLSIASGKCSQNYYPAFEWDIASFKAKTVGGVKIGTYFAPNGLGTVAAKATTQATPIGACGKWILEFQATKLNLYKIQHNPIALRLIDHDGSPAFCFDIYDALIGTGF